jgi:hypothetical protein
MRMRRGGAGRQEGEKLHVEEWETGDTLRWSSAIFHHKSVEHIEQSPTMVTRQASRMPPTPNGNTTVPPAEPSKAATQAADQVERKSIRRKPAPSSWYFFCRVGRISEDYFDDGKPSTFRSECDVCTHSLCQGITKATAEKKGFVSVCMRCRPGAVKFDFLAPLTPQTSKRRQLEASAGESNTTTSAASHSELRQ